MLLLHSQSDLHATYSHYLAAILRLEGFVDFAEVELSTLDAVTLAYHDLVILPRLSPTRTQAEMLENYLRNGGKLLAFMPDAHFARRLGVTPTWRGIDNGWLHPDPTAAMLNGLCCEAVQIITPAVGWTLGESTTALAQILPQPNAEEREIAGIVHCAVGAGEAILFAYDLPHAIARLRQGDPQHADLSYAGLDGIVRPSELFVGQLALEQMLLPQADLQTALLARLIERLAARPRLWYYPHASQQSVVIMTSDDDWSTHDQFEVLLAGLRQRQATCTFYVVPESKLTPALIEQWEQEGHTFSVHPALASDVQSMLAKDEPQTTQVADMLRANVTRHQSQFGRSVQTIRQHAVRWLGYVEAARVLADLGVAMETNYIAVHPFSLGYMSGSGRPLPFVDTTGEIIPVYQQPTHWTEEVLIHPQFVFSFKWSVAQALAVVGKIIQRAAHDFYTPLCFNSHPVSFATYSSPLIEGSWDLAIAEGMAIVSADVWLDWTVARNGVRIEADGDGWVVHAAKPTAALTILLAGNQPLRDGQTNSTTQLLWGQNYSALELTNLSAGERRKIERA